MPKLNEYLLRRPGFISEVPVTLADGQTWYLPKPRIQFRPVRTNGKFTSAMACGWGRDYWEKLDALIRANSAGPESEETPIVDAQMDLCCALLLRNYDLSDEQLADLIVFDFQEPVDEANAEMRRTLLWTAQGFSPKPSGDGSEEA